MKKLSFFAFVVVGMLLAACSDKDVNAEGGQGDQSKGYMSLAINLPTTPSTRAANDVFDDGTANEYAVQDCALLLFEGSSEATAKFFNAQDITFSTMDDDIDDGGTPDHVTTIHKATASVTGRTSSTGNLYALVLLNYKNVIKSISAEGLPMFNTVDGSVLIDKGTTLDEIRSLKFKNEDRGPAAYDNEIDKFTKKGTSGNRNYFFMTNAVLSKDQGGPAANISAPKAENVFQLALMDPNKIYDTKAMAESNPAGEVFVERAVAKATLSMYSTGGDIQIGNTDLKVNTIEWAIGNMEPQTFIVRNPGDLKYIPYNNEEANNYRFVGGVSTKGNTSTLGNVELYRTYWCVDPLYKEDAVGSYMLPEYSFRTIYSKSGDTDLSPFYCYENTFNVERQSYRNTTRAIIKVTTDGGVFYTINGGDKTTKEHATAEILGYVIQNTEVQDAFEQSLNADKSYKVTEKSIKIDYGRTSSGQYAVTSLTVNASELDAVTFKTDAEKNINAALASCIDKINENFVVFQYEGGVIYYEARFQHFAGGAGATDLAPWNSHEYGETAPAGGSTGSAYPGSETERENNYLGRYGMVRNNWYDVTVTEFQKIGYPEIPDVTVKKPGYEDPDTPDDNLNSYISVKINVLSWAKRTQSWGF